MWISDPNEVSDEATEGGSIGVEGMRLLKVVTVVGSVDDRWLVLEIYSGCIGC